MPAPRFTPTTVTLTATVLDGAGDALLPWAGITVDVATFDAEHGPDGWRLFVRGLVAVAFRNPFVVDVTAELAAGGDIRTLHYVAAWAGGLGPIGTSAADVDACAEYAADVLTSERVLTGFTEFVP